MTHVRPARPQDAAFIIEAQLAMARETETLALDPATVARGVQGVFDDPHRGRYFLAELENAPAGCLLTVPEWSDWRNGTVLWIHSVYVLPSHRRRGVFRALYQHLHHMVRSDPALKGLRLYVHANNAVARRCYRELGMDGEHYQLFEWLK